MVTFWTEHASKTRATLAVVLLAVGLSEALVWLLAWDIVYFLGAPRVLVYWVQYQSAAMVILCLGFAGLLFVPTNWRGRYTACIAAICAVSALIFAPIPGLYLMHVGIPVSNDTPRIEDNNIKLNAYLVDVYDHDGAYYGPALENQDSVEKAGNTIVSGLTYDPAFWVADGERKTVDMARELAAYYADMMRSVKQEIYSLPFKKKLGEAMQGVNREAEEFRRRQAEVEKNGKR